eukprot:6893876-Alexandrium_andersonii.AAC.1
MGGRAGPSSSRTTCASTWTSSTTSSLRTWTRATSASAAVAEGVPLPQQPAQRRPQPPNSLGTASTSAASLGPASRGVSPHPIAEGP